MDSVRQLSNESNDILKFINEVVLKDYDNLEDLAKAYREDAGYYVSVSGTLGDDAKGLGQSMGEIGKGISAIDHAQEQIHEAIQSVNNNLQDMAASSDTVSEEAGKVFDSIEELQTTVQNFNV